MKRIFYIQYTNPAGYPPLQHSSRILAGEDWRVLFLGTGAAGANVLEFPDHRNIIVRRMPFCSAGWRQKLHFIRYCVWVLWTGLVWRPDWIYASDPMSCPLAALFCLVPGVRVLYHEHDSPEAVETANSFLRLISRTRRWVARRSDLCVLPNAVRLERFLLECGPVRKGICVWNCPALSEVADRPRNSTVGSIHLLYHGSIVPERLPSTVLTALTLVPDFVRLRIVGYETAGSKGYVAELQRRARELSIKDRVDFLGAIPHRADLLRVTLQSDIGLALMPMSTSDRNCEAMTGASNKAFDYLACGLALVVSNLPDWREMFVDSGFAVGCDPLNPQSIAAAIGSLTKNPGKMRAMGESGRQKTLEAWNYEARFRPALEQLSRAGGAGTAADVNARIGERPQDVR